MATKTSKEYLIMRLDHKEDDLTIVGTYKYGSCAVRALDNAVKMEYNELNDKKPFMNYKLNHHKGTHIGYDVQDYDEDWVFNPVITYYLVIRE